MSEILVEQLSKRLAGRAVLQGVSLAVEAGTVYGLLGRNGAGKTTLLKHLIGFLRPDAGAASVLGKPAFAAVAHDRQQVSYVCAGQLFPAWARVGDVVGFEQRCRTQFDGRRLEAWLKRQGIKTEQRTSSLSQGECKRLELELAFAAQPRVLLLDEPFTGLDPVAREEAIEALIEHVAGGACAILSSHVLTDLERLCERIGVLAHGRIAVDVTLDELKTGGAIVSASSTQVLDGHRVLVSRHTDNAVTAVVVGLDEAAAQALEARGASVRRASLEELGVELIRCAEADGSVSASSHMA